MVQSTATSLAAPRAAGLVTPRARASARPLRCCRRVLFALAALAAPLAHGQDLLTVAPRLAKVEHEDERVRVVRLHIPEHASIAMHDRPRRVVVSLSPNHVRLTAPDGTSRVTRTEAGTFAWSEPAVRHVANLGSAVENIVIELPRASDATRPVAAPPTAAPADYLSDPWHRWAFENQYVRVYDVRIPPGQTTEFHRHAYDQVSVYVSGGLVSVQVEGQPWSQPAAVAPRGVAFASHATQPLVHRVRNEGSADYRVVLVQFLE